MKQQQTQTQPEPQLPTIHTHSHSSSPRFSTPTRTSSAQRRIAIAVDLSDESALAVKWAVHNYLRPGDAVILLHVRPTSVLYGADWGPTDTSEQSQQKLEDDFTNLTVTKASDLAQPLINASIPFKIHIVKDHDMKERLCLEVERLGLSAVIMGSRCFGAASKRSKEGRLGSVSDYCVDHCVCPVIVVRYDPDDDKDGGGAAFSGGKAGKVEAELHPVPEEEQEFLHNADDEDKEMDGTKQRGLCVRGSKEI